MPTAKVNGVNLYYEVTGEGFPLVLSHGVGESYQSWDSQVKFFSHRYQVITYNHRGFPPSEVPEDPAAYSHETLVEDLYHLLRHLGIQQTHICGLSLGGNITLHLGLIHPEMAKALVVAGTGTGTTDREHFVPQTQKLASSIEAEGMKAFEYYTQSPTRTQLLRKDPKGWREFRDGVMTHSAIGSAHILREVLLKRPTIFAIQSKLQQLRVPTLIMTGDEDEPCIEPALFMKRNIPSSGLVVFPQSGHPINLEEPDLFNRVVLDFLTLVDAGKWAVREPDQVGGLFSPCER